MVKEGVKRTRRKSPEWYAKRGCYCYTRDDIDYINLRLSCYNFMSLKEIIEELKMNAPAMAEKCFRISRYIDPPEPKTIPVGSSTLLVKLQEKFQREENYY